MKEPIRILNLFTIMNRGGAETLVMNYYRAMDRSRIQFDFLVHRTERGAYDDEIEAMGGRIYRMCPIYPQNLLRYRKLLRTFFDQHAEYRILHSHMSELGYFAFQEAIRHQIPVRICHAHNTPVFSSETFVEKFKRLPREILARQMRKLSTDYFACSQEAGEWLFGKKNASNIQMMHNAIDARSFAYDAALSTSLKEAFGWTGKTVIGHVGRFCPQKNHGFLLDIFHAFHQKRPNSLLVLVGTGPLEDKIRKKVDQLGLSDSVCFMGVRNDMPRIYQAFDLFLFPSLYEGLPVSLIEAQAAGLPCVISSTISKQTHIIPNYFPVSLQATAHDWVYKIEEALESPRTDTYSFVTKAEFDIKQNVQWLCEYYVKRINTTL